MKNAQSEDMNLRAKAYAAIAKVARDTWMPDNEFSQKLAKEIMDIACAAYYEKFGKDPQYYY